MHKLHLCWREEEEGEEEEGIEDNLDLAVCIVLHNHVDTRKLAEQMRTRSARDEKT